MTELTKSLESSTRKKIDLILNNLDWNTDEDSHDCNVFTERAKTKEQNKRLKGKSPDYILYKSGTDEIIAVIEAKKKGQNLEEALKQAIEKYAIPLGIKIVFSIDGTFVKAIFTDNGQELTLNGEIVNELLPEKIILKFLEQNTSNIRTISEQIRHTREQLINIFKWADNLLRKEGIRQGVERFTEFANILFFKLITEIEEDKEKKGEDRILAKKYCWDSFAYLPAETMLEYINNTVLPYLCERYNHSGDVFQRKLQIKIPKTLKEIVDKLSQLTLIDTDSDIKGDAFEYFLKQSVTVGNDLGEYFTPRHIVKLMINLTNPQFGDLVYDPCCGTGGFLIEAFKHIKKTCKLTKENMKILKLKTVFGVELTNTARIAKMNMILTGDGHTNVQQKDCLKNPSKGVYDVILTNPPYSQKTDLGELYPIPSKQADCIFIQHIILALDMNGRCAVIVPDGFLSEFKQLAYRKTREWLLTKCSLESVISLPAGVFYPYTGAKTSILVFTKGKPTKKVWFYEINNDGFELNTNRKPIKGKNDIDELLEIWNEKEKSKKGFYVEIQDIINNHHKLILTDYKKFIRQEIQVEDPTELLKQINSYTSEINKKLKVIDDLIDKPSSKISLNKYKLKNITKIYTGGTPSTSNSEYWENGTISWIRSGELKDCKIFKSEKYITEKGLNESNAKLFPKKTVLIALTGATTGKTAILEIESATNQSVTGIYPSDKFIPEYLWYYLRLKYEEIKSKSYGRAQQHIRQGIIEDLEVYLPDLKIQKDIVTLFEEVEFLKEKITQIKIKSDDLFKGLLFKNIKIR